MIIIKVIINFKVVERSTYSHVKYHHLEKLMMKIQAIHQKKAMQFLHLDMESQVIQWCNIDNLYNNNSKMKTS